MFNLFSKFLVIAATIIPLMFAFLAEDCKHQNSNIESQTNNGANIKVDNLKTGLWGGQHISLEVTEQGATIEYDCAHGSIDRKIVLDADGHFNVVGTHVREHGGPVRKDESDDTHPASYSGQVSDDSMKLNVTESDTNQSVGTFTLTYGANPRIMKCR